jgi:ABC-type glycerol-3-phosphate transport system permease component
MDFDIEKPGERETISNRERTRLLVSIIRYVILIPVGFIFLFPFLWAVVTSLKKPAEILIVPIQWLPTVAQWINYTKIFTDTPFTRSFANSLLVSGSITVCVIFFGSLAGFALAKYQFPARNIYFAFILTTMTVPTFIFLMPHYLMIHAFGWVNTYWALVVPGCITAFGIFFMRQFIISTVPDELIDAARIDGCAEFQLFLLIVIPLCKPAFLVLGVVTFITNWNDFLWPLIVTQNREMYTIQVLLSTLQESYGTMKYMPLLMAGTTIAIIPGIILFILAQRQIVQGISLTGMK